MDNLIKAVCEHGDVDIFKFIVGKYGLNVANTKIELKKRGSYYPIHVACENNSIDIVKFIIDECKVNVNIRCEYKNRTPLHYACRKCNMDLIKFLVDRGADIDAEDDSDHAPMHEAISSYFDSAVDVVKFLIDKGAKIRSYKMNPMITAAIYRRFDIIDILIESGLDINSTDRDGDTVAHIIMSSMDIKSDLAKLSKYNNLDMNIQNANGNTPLHILCMKNDDVNMFLYAVKILGADPNKINKDGRTPISYMKIDDKIKDTLRNLYKS